MEFYLYGHGCRHCNSYNDPNKNGISNLVETPSNDLKLPRDVYINNELADRLNAWNFTIFYLKAGKI